MNLFERFSKWLSRSQKSLTVSHRNTSFESFYDQEPELNYDRSSRNVVANTALGPHSLFPPSLPTRALLRESYPHIEEQPKPLGPIYEFPRQSDEPVVFNPTPSLKEEELPEKNRIPWGLPICGCKCMPSHLFDAAY